MLTALGAAAVTFMVCMYADAAGLATVASVPRPAGPREWLSSSLEHFGAK